jgi:hypothetical protein
MDRGYPENIGPDWEGAYRSCDGSSVFHFRHFELWHSLLRRGDEPHAVGV